MTRLLWVFLLLETGRYSYISGLATSRQSLSRMIDQCVSSPTPSPNIQLPLCIVGKANTSREPRNYPLALCCGVVVWWQPAWPFGRNSRGNSVVRHTVENSILGAKNCAEDLRQAVPFRSPTPATARSETPAAHCGRPHTHHCWSPQGTHPALAAPLTDPGKEWEWENLGPRDYLPRLWDR
jgi:hypothetical protein